MARALADELLGATFADVTHPDDVRANHQALARLHRTPDEPVAFVKRYVRADGAVLQGLVTVSLLTVDGERRYLTEIAPTELEEDDRSLRRAEQAAASDLLAGQGMVLEGVVRGVDLAATLHAVAQLAERSLPGAFCALHVLAPSGHVLELAAGARLPLPMRERALRLPLGADGGVAGSAAAHGRLVVAEVPPDPRTTPSRALAAQFGVRSAWRQPLVGRDLRVLGVLSCYVTRPGAPDPVEEARLQVVAGLATLALERDDMDQRMREQALHDPLTGLPNRTLLLQRADHALAQNSRTGSRTALLFCDVDRLKPVNDGLGHHVGDQLLVAVGRRLSSHVRAGDTVARLSGDEFVVLLDGVCDEDEARTVTDRVLAGVVQPLVLGEHELHPSLSVGLALSPPHASSVSALDLLRDADTAMYEAKAAGRGRSGPRPPTGRRGDTGAGSSRSSCAARWRRTSWRSITSRRSTSGSAGGPGSRPWCGGSPTTAAGSRRRSSSAGRGGRARPSTRQLGAPARLCRRGAPAPSLGDLTVSVNLSARQLVDPGLHGWWSARSPSRAWPLRGSSWRSPRAC